jgi:hypothetical protein
MRKRRVDGSTNDPSERSEGLKELTEQSRKDGHTVKKLIALLLAVAFICAGTVGCGEKATTGGGKSGGTSTAK